MKRKNLSLDEKMKVIEYANKNPTKGCRFIGKHFSIGKTCVANILKNTKTLEKEYEFFKGNCKKLNHGQYHVINEILITWYGRCANANIFPDGPMLMEEAMSIKARLNRDELAAFTASKGWLEKFKQTYGLRETRITGEADDILRMTIQSWIERLPELTAEYELKDLWNMDKLGLFFKALPEKGLVQKSKKCKGGKKSKQRFTAAFFVAADGSKVSQPIVIWKSKSPRCFKNIQDKNRPSMVYYFSNDKAWMRTEIMEVVLGLLDRKVQLEGRKVILFLDNAPCHPETLQSRLKNIKLIFLPKSTTSRLQPLDAGIIRAFKCKYRKLLMKYVVARIDEGKNASEIIKDVNIAQAIHWLQVAWKDISKETILHCFQKCGFEKLECHSVSGEGEVDEEFESLVAQLREDDDITVEDFITFDDNLTTSIGQINTDMVDWRQQAREDAIQEVISDDDDDDDEEDHTPQQRLSATQALQNLDELLRFSLTQNNESLTTLITEATETVETMKLSSLKQSSIRNFFVRS